MALGTLNLMMFMALTNLTRAQQESFENMTQTQDITNRISETQQKISEHVDEKEQEALKRSSGQGGYTDLNARPIAMPRIVTDVHSPDFGAIASGVQAAEGYIGYDPTSGKAQTYSEAAEKFIELNTDGLAEFSQMLDTKDNATLGNMGLNKADADKLKTALQTYNGNGSNGIPATPDQRQKALDELKQNDTFLHYFAHRIAEDGKFRFEGVANAGQTGYDNKRKDFYTAAVGYLKAEINKGESGAKLNARVPVFRQSAFAYERLLAANNTDPNQAKVWMNQHAMQETDRGDEAKDWSQASPIDIVIKPFAQAKAFLNAMLRVLNTKLNGLTMKQKRIDMNIQMYEKMLAKAEQQIPKALNIVFGGGQGQG